MNRPRKNDEKKFLKSEIAKTVNSFSSFDQDVPMWKNPNTAKIPKERSAERSSVKSTSREDKHNLEKNSVIHCAHFSDENKSENGFENKNENGKEIDYDSDYENENEAEKKDDFQNKNKTNLNYSHEEKNEKSVNNLKIGSKHGIDTKVKNNNNNDNNNNDNKKNINNKILNAIEINNNNNSRTNSTDKTTRTNSTDKTARTNSTDKTELISAYELQRIESLEMLPKRLLLATLAVVMLVGDENDQVKKIKNDI